MSAQHVDLQNTEPYLSDGHSPKASRLVVENPATSAVLPDFPTTAKICSTNPKQPAPHHIGEQVAKVVSTKQGATERFVEVIDSHAILAQ